jgi:hypothetical protein
MFVAYASSLFTRFSVRQFGATSRPGQSGSPNGEALIRDSISPPDPAFASLRLMPYRIVTAWARFGACLPQLNPRGLRAMRTVSFQSSPATTLRGTPSPKTTCAKTETFTAKGGRRLWPTSTSNFTLPGPFGSDTAHPMINRARILQAKFSRPAGRLSIPPAPSTPKVTM